MWNRPADVVLAVLLPSSCASVSLARVTFFFAVFTLLYVLAPLSMQRAASYTN